jgi:DHA1 family bicyclomycin/chloramphenicol resistance-like MFS transporter
MALFPLVLPLSFATVMGPVAVWACGMALVMPGATTAALSGSPAIAGSAAALMGCLQIGGGFAGSAAASLFPSPTLAMSVVMPGMALIALAAQLLMRPAPRLSAPAAIDETDLELANDPAGIIGAAGDEIEVGVFRKSA